VQPFRRPIPQQLLSQRSRLGEKVGVRVKRRHYYMPFHDTDDEAIYCNLISPTVLYFERDMSH